MESKPNEPQPVQADDDEPVMVLHEDERLQLAKFLDALLEADMTNKNNERQRKQWS